MDTQKDVKSVRNGKMEDKLKNSFFRDFTDNKIIDSVKSRLLSVISQEGPGAAHGLQLQQIRPQNVIQTEIQFASNFVFF